MTQQFAKLYTDANGDQVLVVLSTTNDTTEPCINFSCLAQTLVGDDTRRLVMMQLRYASETQAQEAFEAVTEAEALDNIVDLRRQLIAQLEKERVELATRRDLS